MIRINFYIKISWTECIFPETQYLWKWEASFNTRPINSNSAILSTCLYRDTSGTFGLFAIARDGAREGWRCLITVQGSVLWAAWPTFSPEWEFSSLNWIYEYLYLSLFLYWYSHKTALQRILLKYVWQLISKASNDSGCGGNITEEQIRKWSKSCFYLLFLPL